MEPLGFGNPRIQRLRRLSGRRSARHDDGAFVIEGAGLLAEAVAGGWEIEAQYVAPGGEPVDGAGPVWRLAAGVIERVATTESPQPVIASARIKARSALPPGATFVVVSASVGDPGNLGTMLRCAEAAGADAVVLADGTVDCYAPKVVRASAGALFHVPVVGPLPLGELAGLGLPLVATSSHDGVRHTAFDFTRPLALVFGNEAHGVPDGIAEAAVRIVHAGRAESLNVAMAAAVVCFEVARQRAR